MAASSPAVPAVKAAQRPRRRQWLTALGTAVRTPRGAIGLGLALLVVLIAVIGPSVSPDSPSALVTAPYAKPLVQSESSFPRR